MQPGEKIRIQPEAKSTGFKRYFTGEPSTWYFTGEQCKRGHVAKRYVSSGNCVECVRERYNRQRDKENVEPCGAATTAIPLSSLRAEAKAAGRKRFSTGQPCRRGHVAERYVNSGICVECAREHNRRRDKENAEPSSRNSRLRAEAKAAGRTRYFTGEPCKHDHVSERRVSTGGCVECERQARKANAATRLERKRKWRRENRERKRESDRRWTQANAEKVRAQRRRAAADPTRRLANQLRCMIRKILDGRTGAGKLSHVPKSRVEEVRAKLDADLVATPGAPGSYAEMKGNKWHIDHIVPLTVMIALLPNDEPRSVLAYVASHPDMLRPLPAAENIARSNKRDADAEAALPRFWELVHEARAYANDFLELET